MRRKPEHNLSSECETPEEKEIHELKYRIKALKKERTILELKLDKSNQVYEQLFRQHGNLGNDLEQCEARLQESERVRGVYREALAFYAERNNWRSTDYGSETRDQITMSDLGCKSFNGENNFADFAFPSEGRRARETLAAGEERRAALAEIRKEE